MAAKTNLRKGQGGAAEAAHLNLDIGNLPACVEEVRRAALDEDPGPEDPTNFSDLLNRLDAARDRMPPIYRTAVVDPFKQKLEEIGEPGFFKILLQDPRRERAAGLMMDIAQTVLQNGETFEPLATDAFQEVISDLYDGFLSAEDRRGVKPPDREVLAPLVKWGNPQSGPYTWPIDATSIFGLECAVVNLPPTNARKGLLAWTALSHETAGHDIIHADTGLEAELQEKVRVALRKSEQLSGLAEYWASRIDETASDVFGILNMGAAAGIGLIGYFRGLNAAFAGKPTLRNDGLTSDPHPADILRGFLASATVRLLEFQGAKAWAAAIDRETRKDVTKIMLEGREVSLEAAVSSAGLVAKVLIQSVLESLENHKFIEIQNWRDGDEEIVARLRRALTRVTSISERLRTGTFAAHVVAAATTAAVMKGADIPSIFGRMLGILKQMHDGNESWGPLFVRHPGSIYVHRAYTFQVESFDQE